MLNINMGNQLVMTNLHGLSGPGSMIGEPRTLSKSQFARKVSLSPGRISQLIKKGLPTELDGKIDVARGRIWIQENVDTNRSAAQKPDDLFSNANPKASVSTERLRLVKEQADAAALKNAIARRDYVPASEVEREWSSVMRKLRSGILAIPSRVRQVLPHLTAQDVATLDAELRRTLEGLAGDE